MTNRGRLAAGACTALLAVLLPAPAAVAESVLGPEPTQAEAARPIGGRLQDMVVTTATAATGGALAGGHS
jgi:hypothetical protein